MDSTLEGQKMGRQREGERNAAKGHGWKRTRAAAVRTIASVNGAPPIPTELYDTPEVGLSDPNPNPSWGSHLTKGDKRNLRVLR